MKPILTSKSRLSITNHSHNPTRPKAPFRSGAHAGSACKSPFIAPILLLVGCFAIFALTACQSTPARNPDAMRDHPIAHVPLDPDIVEVKKFFSVSPWLSFDPNNSRKPGGFKVVLYLISAKTQRGAFGDGIIHVIMSLTETDQSGTKNFREVRRWSYDPQQALLYRVKKKTVLGYGYQFRCNWEDADVLGKEIVIRLEFERKDGRVLAGQPNYFRPPMH